MSKPCRFCGATDRRITKEHVWPQWLADFLPGRGTLFQVERWSSSAGRQRFSQPFLGATVREVCDRCNNGWMGEIEGMAKGLVGPMAQGLPMTLDTAAQRVVANWVAVKCLVAALTSQIGQPIPEYHYGRVCAAQGAPPNTMRIWIGWRRNLAHPARLGAAQIFDYHFTPVTGEVAQFPMPPELEDYRLQGGVFNGMSFQVGHFFALALQHDWPGLQARPRPGSKAAHALLPIWPGSSTLEWPPPRPVDALGNLHKVTQFLQIAPSATAVDGP